jgi:hypothetical protein
MQGHDYLRADWVERSPEKLALRMVLVLPEICPVNEVRVHLKPSQQRITLVVFQIVGFGQTTEAGAQPKHFARAFSAEQANSRHPRGVASSSTTPRTSRSAFSQRRKTHGRGSSGMAARLDACADPVAVGPAGIGERAESPRRARLSSRTCR